MASRPIILGLALALAGTLQGRALALSEDGAADLFGVPGIPARVQELLRATSSHERRIAIDRLESLDPRVAAPYIRQRLADADAGVRARAAQALGRLQALDAAPDLIDRLTDADATVRGASAEALGRYGALPPGLAQRMAPVLGRTLGDTQFSVRLDGLRALERMVVNGLFAPADLGVLLGPVLLRLEDENVGVRRAAVAVLGRLGPLGLRTEQQGRIVAPLLARLSDSARDVRESALMSLGALGAKAAAPAALRLLRDPVDEVRRQAAQVLGQLQVAEAVPALEEALQQGSEALRTAAAQALGQIARGGGVAPARPLLRCAVREDARPVCREVLLALGGGSLPALLAMLKEADSSAMTLLDLLRDLLERDADSLPPPVRAEIGAVLEQELLLRRVPREQVLGALGVLGGRGSAALCAALLGDEDVVVRRAAVRALRGPRLLDERALDVLLDAAQDADAVVRQEALGGLGALRSAAALPRLRVVLGNGRLDIESRQAALRAISQIGERAPLPAELVGDLQRILFDSSRDGGGLRLRRAAAQLVPQALARSPERRGPVVAALVARLSRGAAAPETPELLTALAGILRGARDGLELRQVRELLQDLAESNAAPGSPSAVAALGALGALAVLRDGAAAGRIQRVLTGAYEPLRRMRAAAALGGLLADPVVESAGGALISALLSDEDARVRAEVAWALSRIRPGHPLAARAEAALRQALQRNRASAEVPGGAGDPGERANLIAALARLGRGSVDDAALLQDRETAVRANALWALGGLRELSPGMRVRVDAISKTDEDGRVRRAAQAVLGGRGRAVLEAGDRRHFLGVYHQDLDRQPLAEVRYRLTTPEGLMRIGTTDSRGVAWEEMLPPGRCEVEVIDDGLRLR